MFQHSYLSYIRGRRGRDSKVVGFITANDMSTYQF
jgi:hypothetical protein